MKNYKLLLLGLIITLFGICNYSSAVNNSFDLTCNVGGCNPNPLIIPNSVSSWSDLDISIGSINYGTEPFTVFCLDNSSVGFDLIAIPGNVDLENECYEAEFSDDGSYCRLNPEEEMCVVCRNEGINHYEFNVSTEYDLSHSYNCTFDEGVDGSVNFVFTYDDGQTSGGGNEGGNEGGTGTGLIGQLTPIITGLDNAIVEFIPYVVYVGLGVLGVLIGFFAIKRLIIWIKGNTLSVFNSRRKRK